MRWVRGIYYVTAVLCSIAAVVASFTEEWLQGIFFAVLTVNANLLVIVDILEDHT